MSTWRRHTSVAKNQLVRLIFAKNWPRHEYSIHITMRMMTKHQIKRDNNENMAIVSSCYPGARNFLEHESSQQTVNIRSTNAIHAKKGYIPIAYAPQESTGVQNVSVIILHVPKTIFQHQAEFSCSKPKKMACQ